PKVVLQNWRSASNAEMFPAGFKALGLGKTIGTPTMGAVIGTGSYSLIDGAHAWRRRLSGGCETHEHGKLWRAAGHPHRQFAGRQSGWSRPTTRNRSGRVDEANRRAKAKYRE